MSEHHSTPPGQGAPQDSAPQGGASKEEVPNYLRPPFDREIRAGAILKLSLGLGVVTLLAFVLMWWLYLGFADTEAAKRAPRPTFAGEEAHVPPGPQLQTFPPTEDIEAFHAWEDEMLGRWTLVNEEEGMVRIPVDRAIEILAERGLPERGELDTITEELFGEAAPEEEGP